MRHNSKVSPIRSIHKERQPSHQSEHRRHALGVREPDRDLERAHDHAKERDPELLRPHGPRVPVDQVADHAAGGAEQDVEEAEHGGPLAGAGLAQRGEVLEVVGADYGVYG